MQIMTLVDWQVEHVRTCETNQWLADYVLTSNKRAMQAKDANPSE